MQVNPQIPTDAQIAALLAANQDDDNSNLPPVPTSGPYGAPAVTMSPLAAALSQSGGMPGPVFPSQASSPPAALTQPAPPPQDQQSPGFLQMLADGLRGIGGPPGGSRYDPSTGQFLPPDQQAPQIQPAVANANTLPAPMQVASASSDSGTSATPAGEDPRMAGYRALHDQAVSEFNRNKALAMQAAQAGNTDLSGTYVMAAQQYYKLAEDISLRAIETQKPADTSTNEQKNFEYAQTHPGFPVPGAAKLELRELAPDQYGRPQYGTFNPQTGEIKPYAPPRSAGARPAAAAADVETDTAPPNQPVAPLPPDQKATIAQLDPAVQGHVTAILQGRETMPKIPAGGRVNPITQMITQGVFAVNPNFDAANNITQVQTRKTYAPGPNNNAPGNLIQNGDTALDHLAELKDASDKLANYGSVVGGAVSGLAGMTGGRIGHDYSAARAELDTKAQIASAEAIKYLAGATGGGEAERDRLMQQFSSANPPDSRLAAINGLSQDILQKKIELQAGWRRSMGPNTPDFEVISPNSVQSVNKLGLGTFQDWEEVLGK